MRQEIQTVKEGLERIYNAEYLFKKEDPPVKSVLDALYMKPNDIIIDFGAGVGRFSLPIAKYFEKSKGSGIVFACDFSKALIEELERHATLQGVDSRVRTMYLTDLKPNILPFEDERVESVLAVNSIQYLLDPVPYLHEIARVLAPCGSLLIADWRRDSPGVSTMPSPKGSLPEGLLPDDLFPLLEEAGLDARVPLRLDGYFWAIQATKPIVIFP